MNLPKQGGCMYSHYQPMQPYYTPAAFNQLASARQSLFENYFEQYNCVKEIIKAAYDSGRLDAMRGFWVFFSEWKRDKDPAQEAFANSALNITPNNVCDHVTRFNYLSELVKITQYLVDCEQHKLILLYAGRLLFEMNLIAPPKAAIQRLGGIIQEYYTQKMQVTPGWFAAKKQQMKKAVANHEEDRARQLDFKRISYQLLAMFDVAQARFYLAGFTQAIKLWLALEIDFESCVQTDKNRYFQYKQSESELYKIFLKDLGCVDTENNKAHANDIPDTATKRPHTNDFPEDIKKILLTQLGNFFAELNENQWNAAAFAAGIPPQRTSVVLKHYLTNYREKLAALIDAKITFGSYQETVGIVAKKTVWNGAKMAAFCSIPAFAQQLYLLTSLETATSAISGRAAQRAAEHFCPAVSWAVKKPLSVLFGATLGAGVITALDVSISSGLGRYLEYSAEEKYPANVRSPQISFEDFIKVCSHFASKEQETFYSNVTFIFPLLREDIKLTITPALYFVPNAPKGKCPFMSELPEQTEFKAVPHQAAYAPYPAFSPPPASAPPAANQQFTPIPSAPPLSAAPLSPHRALNTFAPPASVSSPPPYGDDDWELCEKEKPVLAKVMTV